MELEERTGNGKTIEETHLDCLEWGGMSNRKSVEAVNTVLYLTDNIITFLFSSDFRHGHASCLRLFYIYHFFLNFV